MTYKIEIIKDKNIWDNFLTENNFDFMSFLSSWEWWEFQILAWKKVFRLGVYEWKKLIWVLPLIKNEAKRWTYFFAPHSPMILKNYDFFEVIKDIKNQLLKLAKENNVDFIRFNSPLKNTIINKNKFKEIWFIDAPMHEHAEDTHLLDLNPNEE